MAKIINFPINQHLSVSPLNPAGAFDLIAPANGIHAIPIIRQATFFLNAANCETSIKLTETGALERKFVQAFWNEHLVDGGDPFRPTREFECPEVTRIHTLLSIGKYVRKFKGAISITPKGQRILESGPTRDLYWDLLAAGIYGWNWGFEDRYPDHDFIQGPAKELIHHLWHWPASIVNAAEFFESAFDGTGKTANEDGSEDLEAESHKSVVRCFSLRFFTRFCVPFGILRDLSEPRLLGEPSDPFEKTEFFKSDFPKIFRP